MQSLANSAILLLFTSYVGVVFTSTLSNEYRTLVDWDTENLESLAEANKAWIEKMRRENPKYFDYNKLGHSPKIMWIGCSDSRVPANEIFGEAPGSVFVHRNIANMVVNTDTNVMSVMQYAVDYLKVKHIIVCGHYDCGGVAAALELTDLKSPIENWLRNIRDTARLHKDELFAIADKKERARRLVELNVLEQTVNVFKAAHVQQQRAESRKIESEMLKRLKGIKVLKKLPFTEPQVHAVVFDPATGILTRLDVAEHIKKHLKELAPIYEVYTKGIVPQPL